jgi:KUP system potassium uptake protein
MLIVTPLTYVTLVMRADNDGEGGVMVLITLVRRFGGRSDRRVCNDAEPRRWAGSSVR